MRSPVTYVRSIATSCVPLQLWWSVADRIVMNQGQQSAALFKKIKALNPKAPIQAYVGYWAHSHEMQASTRLPLALADFGLIQEHPNRLAFGIRVVPEPANASRCGNGRNAKPPLGHAGADASRRRPAALLRRGGGRAQASKH